MSLLFDRSPQRPKRRDIVPEAQIAPLRPVRSAAILGREDQTPCLDTACQAACNDVTEQSGGMLRLVCVFCGTGQWVFGHLPEDATFRFASGRYQGQTIAEASGEPRGLEYLGWAAAEHPQQAARKACGEWLAQSQTIR